MSVADPTLRLERAMHRDGVRFVIGCDEVGRGAIAGPVAIGLSVVGQGVKPHPKGLRDSKMLSEKKREQLAPLAQTWSMYSAVGLATAEEIDRIGIIAALGLAGRRALTELHELGVAIHESIVVLDGKHDYLTPSLTKPPRVHLRVKADRDCASVAAASVIAKVHRDRIMIDADDEMPGYGWRGNKGYGSTEHYAGLDTLGPSALHRHTWLHARPQTLFDGETAS